MALAAPLPRKVGGVRSTEPRPHKDFQALGTETARAGLVRPEETGPVGSGHESVLEGPAAHCTLRVRHLADPGKSTRPGYLSFAAELSV